MTGASLGNPTAWVDALAEDSQPREQACHQLRLSPCHLGGPGVAGIQSEPTLVSTVGGGSMRQTKGMPCCPDDSHEDPGPTCCPALGFRGVSSTAQLMLALTWGTMGRTERGARGPGSTPYAPLLSSGRRAPPGPYTKVHGRRSVGQGQQQPGDKEGDRPPPPSPWMFGIGGRRAAFSFPSAKWEWGGWLAASVVPWALPRRVLRA